MAISEDEKARLKSVDTTKYVKKTTEKTESRVLRAGLTDAKLQEHFDQLYGKDLSPEDRLRLGIKRNMEVLEQHVQEQEKSKRLAEQRDAAYAKTSGQTETDSAPKEELPPKIEKFEMNFDELLGNVAPRTGDNES